MLINNLLVLNSNFRCFAYLYSCGRCLNSVHRHYIHRKCIYILYIYFGDQEEFGLRITMCSHGCPRHGGLESRGF